MKVGALIGASGLVMILTILFNAALWWGVASLVGSGFKTATDKCDESWPVDDYFKTDLLCSK